MKIQIKRFEFRNDCTIGRLSIDGVDQKCFTMEPVYREVEGQDVSVWKIDGVTAVPKGTYTVVVTPSERFGRPLPLLVGIPGFVGVRIHPGNFPRNTEGCILTGAEWGGGSFIGHSLDEFNVIFSKIQGYEGTTTIEIS